jgi:hypothetical protein
MPVATVAMPSEVFFTIAISEGVELMRRAVAEALGDWELVSILLPERLHQIADDKIVSATSSALVASTGKIHISSHHPLGAAWA